jgi:hypothetical protein
VREQRRKRHTYIRAGIFEGNISIQKEMADGGGAYKII